jgi:hypothetical protein
MTLWGADSEDISDEEEIKEGRSEEERRRRNQRTFEQQERERQSPHQTLSQQRQHEFGVVEWLLYSLTSNKTALKVQLQSQTQHLVERERLTLETLAHGLPVH